MAKEILMLRLEKDQKRWLRSQSRKEKVSISALMREALELLKKKRK